jgi:hypothetical protein
MKLSQNFRSSRYPAAFSLSMTSVDGVGVSTRLEKLLFQLTNWEGDDA